MGKTVLVRLRPLLLAKMKQFGENESDIVAEVIQDYKGNVSTKEWDRIVDLNAKKYNPGFLPDFTVWTKESIFFGFMDQETFYFSIRRISRNPSLIPANTDELDCYPNF